MHDVVPRQRCRDPGTMGGGTNELGAGGMAQVLDMNASTVRRKKGIKLLAEAA
jgi:hypothetical protein